MSETGPTKGERARWWVAWCVLIVAAGWVVMTGARTSLVVGRYLGPVIERAAEGGGVDVEIAAFDAVGWTGVAFKKVVVRRVVGGQEMVWMGDSVEVYPDVKKSLRAGRPVLARIVVGEGILQVARADQGEAAGAQSAAEQGESGASEKEGVGVEGSAGQGAQISSVRRPAKQERRLLGWRDYLAEEIEVEMGVSAVSIHGRWGEVRGVRGLIGRDDGVFRELTGRVVAGEAEAHLEVVNDEIWVRPKEGFWPEALPLEVGFEALVVPGRLSELGAMGEVTVGIEGLEVKTRGASALSVEARRSKVHLAEGSLEWGAARGHLTGPERSYAIENVEAFYRGENGGFGYQGRVVDGQGGWAELEGKWHLETGILGLNIWLEEFFWDGSVPFLKTELAEVEGARLKGVMHGDVDLQLGVISLDGGLEVEGLAMNMPLLTSEPFEVEAFEVELPVTVDVGGGAISILGGRLTLGELGTFRLDGHVVEARDSYAFRLDVGAPTLNAAALSEALPEELLGAVNEIEMAGEFGLRIHTEGHTAYPESLLLDVEFFGDVEILEDLSWDEEGEGFLRELPGHRTREIGGEDWTYLAALPAHVPAAILSAEDAMFYEHQGLDWTGIRMAMVHNLEAGALVRGGSTISQQVAKNLFLSPERTLSRKFQEAFLTWRLEASWDKEEILELYLNVVQMGPGVNGLRGAANDYFGKGPEALTVLEAVLLGAVLPSPQRFGGTVKAGYLPSSREDKMRRILVNMRFVGDLDWAQYFAALEELDAGRVGEWAFQRCGDDETAEEDALSCEVVLEAARAGEWEAPGLEGAGWVPLTQ